MEYRQLGGSGLKVPALSFGTGTFGGAGELFSSWGSTDVGEATRLVDICLEAGLNMFDSADVYSGGLAGEILGKAIKGRRDAVLISCKLMPLGLDQKVGAVVWSPLGWGRLSGKIRRGAPPPAQSRLHSNASTDAGPQVPDEYLFKVVDALDEVAAETGKTVPQIALNWLLQRPTVASVIVGARNEDQLRQNLGAVGWNLTREQVAKLDAASASPASYPYWHQQGFPERNPFPSS